MRKPKIWLALPLALLASACAPKVYVVDRQTVLEEEAAAGWPQFDKELLEKTKVSGPTPFSTVPVNARRKRLYNVLNGDMVSSASEPAPKAAAPAAAPAPAPKTTSPGSVK